MNRREFIGVTAAAGATLAVAGVSRESVSRVVLFDARYADSRSFAETLAEQGFLALPTNQDVVRLWYDTPAMRSAVQIAGVTPHSDFEILRRLLRENQRPARLTKFSGHRALTSWLFA